MWTHTSKLTKAHYSYWFNFIRIVRGLELILLRQHPRLLQPRLHLQLRHQEKRGPATSRKHLSHGSKCEIKSAMLVTVKVWNKSALKNSGTKMPCYWHSKWIIISHINIQSDLRNTATRATNRHQRIKFTLRKALSIEDLLKFFKHCSHYDLVIRRVVTCAATSSARY